MRKTILIITMYKRWYKKSSDVNILLFILFASFTNQPGLRRVS